MRKWATCLRLIAPYQLMQHCRRRLCVILGISGAGFRGLSIVPSSRHLVMSSWRAFSNSPMPYRLYSRGFELHSSRFYERQYRR